MLTGLQTTCNMNKLMILLKICKSLFYLGYTEASKQTYRMHLAPLRKSFQRQHSSIQVNSHSWIWCFKTSSVEVVSCDCVWDLKHRQFVNSATHNNQRIYCKYLQNMRTHCRSVVLQLHQEIGQWCSWDDGFHISIGDPCGHIHPVWHGGVGWWGCHGSRSGNCEGGELPQTLRTSHFHYKYTSTHIYKDQ